MSDTKNLHDTIKDKILELRIPYNEFEIPEYITSNIKHELFEWQKKALEYFLMFEAVKKRDNHNTPTHLMFNMATGSGKTLIMAAAILYYYKQGYRHFIFLVNQNNIVDKTQNNFINKSHTKYLFKDKIAIDDKIVNIKEVENFTSNPKNIEIKFTTIQKLHNDIHLEKENQVTLNELNKKDIVILADEAHHLNADTKRKDEQLEFFNTEISESAGKDEVERKGWEHTVVNLILNKNGQIRGNKNVLLEFTATMDEDEKVVEKYKDKVIYKFALKEFLSAGYTKEINLISSRFNKKERILQALLFNWYREQTALKYFRLGNDSLMNFKPVILFRSKTIEESRKDYAEFLNIIKNLKASDFKFVKDIENKINEGDNIYEQGKSKTVEILEFIKRENISYSQIVEWIKEKFAEKNCIITNSKDNTAKTIEKTTEEQEMLLNSLEDKNNHIRAIFTVKRLTEGWDVLNLYDIVRLYEGQNAGGSTRETPEATIQEKQLIGRGVRYFPFDYKNKIKNKRKFDDDMSHELRILEELNYYTYDEESRYISHLKEELRKDGYIKDSKVKKVFRIKDDFKETDLYKYKKIWKNKRDNNPNRRKNTLEDIDKNFYERYEIKTFGLKENKFGYSEKDDIERLDLKEKLTWTIDPIPRFKDFDKNIIYKAINIKAKDTNSLFQFKNLKKELNIDTIDDLIDEKFLGDFTIPISSGEKVRFDEIPNTEKLSILLDFLGEFEKELRRIINPYEGTEFEPFSFEEVFGKPKEKIIELNKEFQNKESELKKVPWYVLDSFNGTDEEIAFINDFENTIDNLREKYEEVYLLRNEEVYKIYDFDKGRGFQPDFILFLRDKDEGKYYQVFIEPKGDYLKERDEWKDKFLKAITKKYGENDVLKYEDDTYRLIGLPLYNSDDSSEFNEEFQKLWQK
ncbi:putative type III restriction/modification system enzyme [[Clostridium] ultunense Esp]|nr:putative type III restriction/modification system enzyme [[Clostridium] ultunense Esp]